MPKLFFEHALLPNGWARDVVISVQAGTIVGIETAAAPSGVPRLKGIALPGMPNLHSHTFQRGMAGLAEVRGPRSDNFWTWRQVMYQFLSALTPDDVEAIAAFAMMEMLEGGFSALVEFHYLHNGMDGQPYANSAELAVRIAAAASNTGIGLTLLPVYYQFGGFGGAEARPEQRRFINTPDRFLRLFDDSRTAIRHLDDAAIGIAPHSLRAVTPETLAEVLKGFSGGPIHIHVAEQTKEVEDCLAWSGQRPVQWLLENVAVDERWCFIHATHTSDDEIREMSSRRVVAGLCPITEANLGDGIVRADRLLQAGARFGIGSDSNIDIGAPEELKQLEYSQRLSVRSRNIMTRDDGESTGRHLHEAALAGGRQASGRQVGALAEGFRADIVVLRSDHPDLGTVHGDRWLDAYVFSLGRTAIDSVFVGGRQVVKDGRHIMRQNIVPRYMRTRRRLLGTRA